MGKWKMHYEDAPNSSPDLAPAQTFPISFEQVKLFPNVKSSLKGHHDTYDLKCHKRSLHVYPQGSSRICLPGRIGSREGKAA